KVHQSPTLYSPSPLLANLAFGLTTSFPQDSKSFTDISNSSIEYNLGCTMTSFILSGNSSFEYDIRAYSSTPKPYSFSCDVLAFTSIPLPYLRSTTVIHSLSIFWKSAVPKPCGTYLDKTTLDSTKAIDCFSLSCTSKQYCT